MDKVLHQTSHGRIFVCQNCDKIHVEFFNFLYSFNKEEFEFFKNNIERIDGCYYERANSKLSWKRKIVVPLGHKNVSMVLNQAELEELQLLLAIRCCSSKISCFVTVKEIGMPIASN